MPASAFSEASADKWASSRVGTPSPCPLPGGERVGSAATALTQRAGRLYPKRQCTASTPPLLPHTSASGGAAARLRRDGATDRTAFRSSTARPPFGGLFCAR